MEIISTLLSEGSILDPTHTKSIDELLEIAHEVHVQQNHGLNSCQSDLFSTFEFPCQINDLSPQVPFLRSTYLLTPSRLHPPNALAPFNCLPCTSLYNKFYPVPSFNCVVSIPVNMLLFPALIMHLFTA